MGRGIMDDEWGDSNIFDSKDSEIVLECGLENPETCESCQ